MFKKIKYIIKMLISDEIKRRKGKPPNVSEKLIKNYVYLGVGIYKNLKIQELDSYDDRNYLVYVSGTPKIIVKIHNEVESTRKTYVEAQVNIMRMLNNAGFIVPEDLINIISSSNGLVRILRYIPGKELCSIPINEIDWYILGQTLGSMDTFLEKNPVKGVDIEHIWDIRHFLYIESFMNDINLPNDWKDIITKTFIDFKDLVIPFDESLPRSIIQNDPNVRNILLLPNQTFGLIDFGCMCNTWTINQLAMTLAYVAIQTFCDNTQIIQVFHGYNTKRQLSEIEIRVLIPLIQARLVTSIVMGIYSSIKEPENSEYLLSNVIPAMETLKKIIHSKILSFE